MFKKTLLDTVEVWRESFGPLIDTTLTALLFGVCLASGLETARWLNDDLFFHQAWHLSVLLPIVIGILVSFFLFKFSVFLIAKIQERRIERKNQGIEDGTIKSDGSR